MFMGFVVLTHTMIDVTVFFNAFKNVQIGVLSIIVGTY